MGIRFASTAMMAVALAVGGLSAAPAVAKGTASPAQVTAAPAVTIINGSPLQIHVGDDSSFQVFNSDVPGSGQVYPTDADETADMGWFVRTADTLFAPNFSEHPAGTATTGIGAYTAFTPVALSGVTGAGTTQSPYRVTVTGTLGGSGLSADLQVAYVNGDNYFTKVFTVTNGGGSAQTLKIFFGADIYLASSDAGVPFREPVSGSPGGQDCATVPPTYTILLIPQSQPDAYTGRSYSTVWNEIGGGQLDNGTDATCEDNGAALQWNRTVAAGASTTIQASTSFGEIPAITQFNVTAVNPPSGNPGASVPVTISGIGFLSTTTFDFGAAITVGNLQIVDSYSATATLTIDAAAAPGPRDVVATQGQPDLQGGTGGVTATLVNGFTVLGGGVIPSTPIAAPTLNAFGLLALLLALMASAGFAWRRI